MLWQECKTTAQGFLHRTDINLDALQPLVVADINLRLEVQENEGGFSATLADNGDGLWFVPLPVDFRTVRAVDVDTLTFEPVDIKTLRQAGAGRSWYAISGMSAYTTASGMLDMLYTTRLLPAADGGTNPVLDRYPQIYLYGLLKQAAIVCQDYDAAQIYGGQFTEYVEAANAMYLDATYGPGMAVSHVPGGVN